MRDNVTDLLRLIRESDVMLDATPEELPEVDPHAPEGVVGGAEAKSLLSDIEDLDEPMGDSLLPEEYEQPEVTPALVGAVPTSDQPKADGSKGAPLPNPTITLQKDEIEASVDPDVAEILAAVDEDYDLTEAEKGEEYGDFDGLGLNDDEVGDVVAKLGSDEQGESGEEASEKEALPGTGHLPPEQAGMLRRLFDSAVLDQRLEDTKKAVRLAEQVWRRKAQQVLEAREAHLNGQINHYLSYVVEQWMAKNEVPLASNVQIKAAKRIFNEVRSICELFDIDTVDATASIVEMYESKILNLEKKTSDLIEQNAGLLKEMKIREKALVIEEATVGLPITEIEKFKAVAASIKSSDLETFKENVEIMRESFLAKPKKGNTIETTNEALALGGGIKGAVSTAPKSEAEILAQILTEHVAKQ
jgi:hypothetical protein